jgi:hypothetical protein
MESQIERQVDGEPVLTREEADVAGIGPTPETVYGDDSYEPNADDHRDVEHADEDEHV